MREDHDCANLPPIGARARSSGAAQPTSKEKGLAALERFKRWGAAKKAAAASSGSSGSSGGNSFLKKRSSAATAAAELNALKAAAKGDAKIPVEKRLYLHVEASADTTKAKFPTGKFFYSRDWSVGRVLDAAASALQVENMNNRGGGEENRLRVFHVEGGRLLEFGQKVGECVKDGNTIVLLRGVGPPVPDLIQP
ncbi:hypothetical protein BDY21DRAFT_350904 [Lineolata rhizophorae]|uniref:ZFAND1-like ubiquitin-like domain-containing protein n=1 Tax=Lineolata rhizophorae TaxID=578093 RepID=A0A6A6NTX0_9PEZI|nr:hypothetical protein BDY21DRAFT_350904 [Lineolata rhizophorae]